MHSRTRGFTLIELLIVIVIVGILTMVALPKIGSANRSNAVHAASRKTVAYLSQARALAIQNGREARFVANSGGVITIELQQGDLTNFTPIGTQNLAAEHKVSFTASPAAETIVTFDPRGLAQLGTAKSRRFIIERDGLADTVCVYGVGKVAVNKCQLAAQ